MAMARMGTAVLAALVAAALASGARAGPLGLADPAAGADAVAARAGDRFPAALAAALSDGAVSAALGERPEAGAFAEAIVAFYAARGYRPVWTEEAGWNERADGVLATFAAARAHGLDPARYLAIVRADGGDGAPPLAAARPLASPARLAASGEGGEGALQARAGREVRLAAAALLYARHAAAGQVDPRRLSRIIDVAPAAPDPAAVLSALADAPDPAAVLLRSHPPHPGFEALRQALGKALDRRGEAPPRLPDGPLLRRGVVHPQVAILRARLGETVLRGTDPTVFDAALAEAVRAFQRENGLVADGIVGPRTRAALDGAADADPVASLVANMERFRWLPRDLGERHVFVNVPAFRVEVRAGAEVTWRGRAIVGRPANPTPVFSDIMDHIVVNPYWNVPYSIASSQLLPSIRRNPGWLTRRGYEVVSNGRVVSPHAVGWSEATLRKVRIRQRPGRGNALGAVKFMFPNRHAVYLHDTPDKHLFDRSVRAFSHGCVRVDRPFDFARALLAGEPSVSGAALEGMVGGRQRWVNLEVPVPVHIAYFTREATADGTIVRHRDLYGFDARLERALGF